MRASFGTSQRLPPAHLRGGFNAAGARSSARGGVSMLRARLIIASAETLAIQLRVEPGPCLLHVEAVAT